MHYEWLLLPAIATALVATFAPRAAMSRGFEPAPLAFLAMLFSFALATTIGVIFAPHQVIEQLARRASLLTALGGGAAGGAGLCFMYAALRQRATGPVITLASMSILIPILLGYACRWDDPPGIWNILGIVLTLAGIAAIQQ